MSSDDKPALTRAEWDAKRKVLCAYIVSPAGDAPSQATTALFGPRPSTPFPKWEDYGGDLAVLQGGRGYAPIQVRFEDGGHARGVTARQARDLAIALYRAAEWDDADANE